MEVERPTRIDDTPRKAIRRLTLATLFALFVCALILDYRSGETPSDFASSAASLPDAPIATMLPGASDLAIFYKSDCASCIELKPFIAKTLEDFSRLKPAWIDIAANPMPASRLEDRYSASYPPPIHAGIPTIFVGDRVLSGSDPIRRNLRESLSLYQAGSLPPSYRIGEGIVRGGLGLTATFRAGLASILQPEIALSILCFVALLGFSPRVGLSPLLAAGAFVASTWLVWTLAAFGALQPLYSDNLLAGFPQAVRFGIAIACFSLLPLALRDKRAEPRISDPAEIRRRSRMLSSAAIFASAVSAWLVYPFLAGDRARAFYYDFRFSPEPLSGILRLLGFTLILISPLALTLVAVSLVSRLSRKGRLVFSLATPLRLAAGCAAGCIGVAQLVDLGRIYRLW